MASKDKKKTSPKRIVNGYVRTEIADHIENQAEALDFTITKYASHILEWWYENGAPAVHPNEPRYQADQLKANRSPPPVVAEEQASYPSLSERIDSFVEGNETKRRDALAIFASLEKNPQAAKGLSALIDGLGELIKKGDLKVEEDE